LKAITNTGYRVFVARTRNYDFAKILIYGTTVDVNGIISNISRPKSPLFNKPAELSVLGLIRTVLGTTGQLVFQIRPGRGDTGRIDNGRHF
jgi:hypothetical protein